MGFQLLAVGGWQIAQAVFLAIIILLAMICVHEFGHFLAGRILHFKIDEFSIGFGPAIFKRRGKKHGTLFSIRLLPLGGYCSFDGEEGEGSSPQAFVNKPPWQRIIVLISGALMNYLLALVLIIIGYFAFGQPCYKVERVTPSEEFSQEFLLEEGDVLLSCEGRDIYLSTDLISALNGKLGGDTVEMEVLRGGEKRKVTVALRSDCVFENSSQMSRVWKALGADTYEGEDGNLYWSVSSQNVRLSFFATLGHSFAYSFKTVGAIFKVLGELLTGNLGLSAMGGPISTVAMTGEMAVQGPQSFLQVAAYIGINLAVFNLLPIPALDGSKVVFCLIEWIFKKPVPRKIEAVIHAVGLAAILIFAVAVDIIRYV